MGQCKRPVARVNTDGLAFVSLYGLTRIDGDPKISMTNPDIEIEFHDKHQAVAVVRLTRAA